MSNKNLKKTYHIVTFGCQMNKADSERIAGYFQKKGYKKAEEYKDADVVIINSCSVRQTAEDRVLGLVNNISKLSPKPKIILTGCMLRYTIYQLKRMLPDVNSFVPIEKLIKGAKPIREGNMPCYLKGRKKSRKHAWVPIMRGCDNFCTYCVVPYSRGREKSRPIEEIYNEIKCLVEKGYQEITLLGQNVNSYHNNSELKIENLELIKTIDKLKKEYKNNFAVLLALIHSIKELKKIHFITSNPHDMTDGIIQAISLPKIDRYLHLAVQSGDDEILKKMNRKYNSTEFLNLINKIREKISDVEIGTDIIVGFPGETKKQFQNTVKLCQKVNFCKAYISKYSPRSGTPAYKMEDNVSHKEKKRRWKILNSLINE